MRESEPQCGLGSFLAPYPARLTINFGLSRDLKKNLYQRPTHFRSFVFLKVLNTKAFRFFTIVEKFPRRPTTPQQFVAHSECFPSV